MKNVRQADMGEYHPFTSFLLCLWGLDGEMVRGVCVCTCVCAHASICVHACVCVFYTLVVFQTLGFILIFMPFPLAVCGLGTIMVALCPRALSPHSPPLHSP